MTTNRQEQGQLLAQIKDAIKRINEFTYVVMMMHGKAGNIETNITPLDFNNDYLFHVRLRSDGFKELRQKRFKFIAKSWDDITLL